MLTHILVASLLLLQAEKGRTPQPGANGPALTSNAEPTPFERFAEKLGLDEKQLPEAGKILSASATQGAAIGRDMLQARLKLADVDGKPEAAPLLEGYKASAEKMTALDVKAFQQVFALLDKGQQKSAPEAFVLTAGLLDMSAPRAPRQPGGRGLADIRPTRLERLTTAFTLTGDQKKQVKTIMDAEYKAASAIRDQWTASRMAIGKAVQSGASAADIDAAVAKHAADASAMGAAEARAFAKIMAVLTPEQKANTAGIQSTIFSIRLAFAGKKWDVSPE